jgi:hypothetical protein
MKSKYRSVKRQKISSSIGSGARGEHVCWTEAGEREEKLQLGDLLHQDVAYKSILRNALRVIKQQRIVKAKEIYCLSMRFA